MSFLEQERALFALLFDRTLRDDFQKNSTLAFSKYNLSEHELNDFKQIRPDAIALDASMRTYLILTQICRQFPVTFSLVSSLQDGIKILQALINLQTMRCHPIQRATVFISQLPEQLATCKIDSNRERAFITAILEAELGMASSGAILKQKLLEDESPLARNLHLTKENTLNQAIKLAAYVSATIIPQSYLPLKKALCPCEDTALWTHLSKKPLSASRRKKTLAHGTPKLFITKAHVSTRSRCEPTVDHQMIELTEGFAPLFQHVNGSMSIAQILGHLQQAGAPAKILQGVEAGFQQLLRSEMLEFA